VIDSVVIGAVTTVQPVASAPQIALRASA